jgi:hypothetical protein
MSKTAPLELLDGRERHPLATDQRHPHAADRTGERQAGDLGGGRRGIDGQHVVEVAGSRLRTVTTTWTSLRRPLTKDGRSGRSISRQVRMASVGRPALTAEERAGDTARRVHPLLDVDGQREEVEVLFGVLAGGGRRQQHGFVVEVGDDSAGGLLGQPAGLESDGAGAEAPVVDYGFGERHRFLRLVPNTRRQEKDSGVGTTAGADSPNT